MVTPQSSLEIFLNLVLLENKVKTPLSNNGSVPQQFWSIIVFEEGLSSHGFSGAPGFKLKTLFTKGTIVCELMNFSSVTFFCRPKAVIDGDFLDLCHEPGARQDACVSVDSIHGDAERQLLFVIFRVKQTTCKDTQ
ncbi:hypothetical protein CDAR_597511 [Caerostris darwini]|uniref:Uncharacterized protein n=1 Tax=Caerostris darwini TaxID=1538125 RepID=A0AAV4TUM2_9ARAC|nr:hypothetical protein CDAR_597511 [Caerostris darwini]